MDTLLIDDVIDTYEMRTGNNASAEAARKQLAELRADLDFCQNVSVVVLHNELEKAYVALDEARKVISFYADKNNWKNDFVDIGVGNIDIPDSSQGANDKGKTAAAWMEKYKETP